MKTKSGDRNNMLVGFGDLDSSRPLKWGDMYSPRVHGRPENLRQIVTLWDRLRAAWAVFTMNAVAVAWYDDRNAHRWPQAFFEPLRERSRQWPAGTFNQTVVATGGGQAVPK